MWRVPLFLIAAPLLAQQHPVDVNLLVERSPGLELTVSVASFTTGPADRVALMSFTERSHVEQPFTADIQKIRTAFGRLESQAVVHKTAGQVSSTPRHHLFRAVLDSIDLFGQSTKGLDRQRVIVAVFATDDVSAVPTGDELKEALLAARIKFFGIAARPGTIVVLGREFRLHPLFLGITR